MVYETGLPIAGSSIVTVCVSNRKIFTKQNGVCNCGCGFTDAPLIDTDELDVKIAELGDVKVLYRKPTHVSHDD